VCVRDTIRKSETRERRWWGGACWYGDHLDLGVGEEGVDLFVVFGFDELALAATHEQGRLLILEPLLRLCGTHARTHTNCEGSEASERLNSRRRRTDVPGSDGADEALESVEVKSPPPALVGFVDQVGDQERTQERFLMTFRCVRVRVCACVKKRECGLTNMHSVYHVRGWCEP
jgi:hypothetical protein